MNNNGGRTLIIRYVLSLMAIALMGAMSSLFGDRSIIYPPAAALVVGLIIADRRPWTVSLRSAPWLLTVAAIAGTALELWLHDYPVTAMASAFAIAVAILIVGRTTLFPVIATCLLPIVLHSPSLVYPVAVLTVSTLCVTLSQFAVAMGWRSAASQSSQRHHRLTVSRLRHWMVIGIGLLPIIAVAEYSHLTALIAPPLTVVFVTLCQPGNRLRRQPRRIIITTALTAACGTMGRMIFLDRMSLPLSVALTVTVALALIAMKIMHLTMPPLAAVSLIPFVIPAAAASFPLLAVIGEFYLILCSRIDVRKIVLARPLMSRAA